MTVKDAGNKPVAGVSVTFTAPAGNVTSGWFLGNSLITTLTVETDSLGVAAAAFTANTIAGGPYTVTATSAGLTTVNFSLTNCSQGTGLLRCLL